MEANKLRFHKNIVKSPMLASKHQNRILSISKNKIKKVMNRVHTWKASSQIEAHLTSSPVFMTLFRKMPRSRPLFPRLLFQIEAHLTSSPVFITLFEDAQIRTSFSKSSLFPKRLTPSSLFPPPQVTLLPSYSPVSQHGFPNYPLQLHASCRQPPALSWGPLPLQSAAFQIPFIGVEFW